MKILLNMKHRKSYLKFSAASDVINEKDYFAKALILWKEIHEDMQSNLIRK